MPVCSAQGCGIVPTTVQFLKKIGKAKFARQRLLVTLHKKGRHKAGKTGKERNLKKMLPIKQLRKILSRTYECQDSEYTGLYLFNVYQVESTAYVRLWILPKLKS